MTIVYVLMKGKGYSAQDKNLPVSNIADKHKEKGSLVYQLRKANNNQVIDFNETLVGSFCKIDNWCGDKVNATDNNTRTIKANTVFSLDISHSTETEGALKTLIYLTNLQEKLA